MDERSQLRKPAAEQCDLTHLVEMLRTGSVLVLSGAGISTESGIPDYRGASSISRPRQPMLFQEFARRAEARQRYWARSLVGWRTVDQANPNRGHYALAELQEAGAIKGVLTQNVDGLHQAAGSDDVLELHGSLSRVRCLNCQSCEPRRNLQTRLLSANPEFGAVANGRLAPDGDAELPPHVVDAFVVPDCLSCGGTLKPDVVMFGENVPADRLRLAWSMLACARALLAIGTSLTVFSGYRFVKRAAELGKPVAIVNLGPTRGDEHAAVRIQASLGEVLPWLHNRLNQ